MTGTVRSGAGSGDKDLMGGGAGIFGGLRVLDLATASEMIFFLV